MEPCTNCDDARKSKRAKERVNLIRLMEKNHKDVPFKKLLIVETRNGILGIREEGDESVTRTINPLPIIEYLYIVQGLAAR